MPVCHRIDVLVYQCISVIVNCQYVIVSINRCASTVVCKCVGVQVRHCIGVIMSQCVTVALYECASVSVC